ncbi:hypothetical protein L6E12_11245 [Actinokineospora sp. PR83]|uniref:hypothetical protein n=1 Tax=Actinokineospora sp. PR83 TaxID=2884908 RepID=UPI001F4848D6|nr:hypothetical protein [Actinokineospora sp. PR83]MCG8916365.1 hypothetical protein [Actinokineospora sp. PR83]
MARLVPGSTVLLDGAAEDPALKEGLHHHALAHFACHGALKQSTPLLYDRG